MIEEGARRWTEEVGKHIHIYLLALGYGFVATGCK